MNYYDFYNQLILELNRKAKVRIATFLDGPQTGEKLFLEDKDVLPGSSGVIFEETLYGRPTAVVCGGGHISSALVPSLHRLGYRIMVVDDRREFATRERFPLADSVDCLDFESGFPSQAFPDFSYYVIATRGHQNDYACLKDILKRKYRYLGMMGSKKKVALAVSRLRDEGASEEAIASIHAPIGLAIGANTPEEIAVSIAAEMIQVKNQTKQCVLEDSVMQGIQQRQETSVMATVIKKQGSSPRGVGARMVVTASGKQYGTIGGGAIEGMVKKQAVVLSAAPKIHLEDYHLGNEQAGSFGMVCGGDVTIYFEPLYTKEGTIDR